MNHATSPTTGTAASQSATAPNQNNQSQIVTTEQIFAGLDRYCSPTGEHLKEPYLPLNKIKGLIDVLLAGFDDESGKILFKDEALLYTLLALSDLAEEARKLLDGWEDSSSYCQVELRKRLNACHLIACNHELWGSLATGKEV
ncbi:MAG: hypothetical protein AB7F61_09050 [Desulfobulbus sp.]